MSKRGRKPPGPPLGEDDQALWDEYTRAVRRLKPHQPHRPVARKAAAPPSAPMARGGLKQSTALPGISLPKPSVAPPPASAIESRLVKRVQRGRHEIEATIDLHGLTQAEAKPRLIAFLRQAQLRGFRMALVITGKGRGSSSDNPYVSQEAGGVLRRAVRLWLDQPECRSLVVGHADAHRRHGGTGAIYVQIRRAR